MSAYYNEIEPFAAEELRNLIKAGHIASGEVDERTIKDVQADDLRGFQQCHFFAGIGVWSRALRQAGWSDDREVWTGSCPCQPFSAAGSRRGFADDRHLWPEFFRLIRECRPDVVLGEQSGSPDGLVWFDAVSADLESSGYTCGALDTCAAGVGAPHIRQRLYWMAHTGCSRRQQDGGGAPSHETADGGTGRHGVEQDSDHIAAGGRPIGRLADSSQGGQRIDGSAPGNTGHASQRDSACGVANAGGGRPSYGDLQRSGRLVQLTQDPLAGFWRGADWLACTDGKARPVEPGTFPLAHGATARVGRLRAYGNALCAPQAEAFVRAAMECLP